MKRLDEIYIEMYADDLRSPLICDKQKQLKEAGRGAFISLLVFASLFTFATLTGRLDLSDVTNKIDHEKARSQTTWHDQLSS